MRVIFAARNARKYAPRPSPALSAWDPLAAGHDLDSGAADAIAVDIGVAKYQLSQREEGKYVILDEPIQSEEYGIGFKKGNDELKDTVWEEVLKLYDAGEVDKLAEKYEVADMLCIGDDEKSDDKKDDAAEDDVSDADTAKEDTADTAKDAE